MQSALAQEVQDWLFRQALPLWATVGMDRKFGGVQESLSLDAVGPSGVDFKRTRVTCRQLYVFSHAEIMGWSNARAISDQIYADLVERFWQGPDKGWVRKVSSAGIVLDPTPDLYDFSFALFSLAWRYRATKDVGALALAHQTLDFVEKYFSHPSGEGFHNQLPPTQPRQQNPHMHLMEALLALHEASSDQRFLATADILADLYTRRLAPTPKGVLLEFFDDAWHPAAGEQGRWVEPGHQFEWAWILAQYQKLSGNDQSAHVAALVAWAERYGVDPSSQRTFNGVDDDGRALDRGVRAWPQAERIKGWIANFEINSQDPTAAICGSTRFILDRMLKPAPSGAWIDALDENGAASVSVIPTSTLYHLFLAFSELLRVAPRLTRGDVTAGS